MTPKEYTIEYIRIRNYEELKEHKAMLEAELKKLCGAEYLAYSMPTDIHIVAMCDEIEHAVRIYTQDLIKKQIVEIVAKIAAL